jgi:hypothetical protein
MLLPVIGITNHNSRGEIGQHLPIFDEGSSTAAAGKHLHGFDHFTFCEYEVVPIACKLRFADIVFPSDIHSKVSTVS